MSIRQISFLKFYNLRHNGMDFDNVGYLDKYMVICDDFGSFSIKPKTAYTHCNESEKNIKLIEELNE